ncbi:MAG: magnesium transporter [Pseudomonadota bacterium]
MAQTPDTASDADRRDDDYELDSELVAGICESVEAGDRVGALSQLDGLHVADVADLLEQVTAEERRGIVNLLWADIDNEVLVELEEGIRDEVLEILQPTELAEAVKNLETDDVVYLVEDLTEPQQRVVLEALEPADRAAVARSLEYPEYSAGRLMQTDFVKAPPFWTVGQMIDALRADDDLPQQFYDVIITDPSAHPVGTIPLSVIIANRRPVVLESLMQDEFRTLHVEDPQEDVAYAFNQYHLVSAPVVDDDGRVVGVITIDDAMEALEEEAEEDIKRLAGLGDEEISDNVWEIARARFVWLLANLATAILASIVIAQFDATLQEVIALAVLMPIVASMGGNAGTQTLTVAVRALATRDLTPTNALRVVWRETMVGLVNGLLFAALIGALTWAYYGYGALGGVIALAMVVNMVVAGMAGILIPMGLDKLGADPALASGTFVTTVTDVVGFFAFLGLAGVVLL